MTDTTDEQLAGVVTGRPLTRLRIEGLAAAGAWWDTSALTVAGAVGLTHLGFHGNHQHH